MEDAYTPKLKLYTMTFLLFFFQLFVLIDVFCCPKIHICRHCKPRTPALQAFQLKMPSKLAIHTFSSSISPKKSICKQFCPNFFYTFNIAHTFANYCWLANIHSRRRKRGFKHTFEALKQLNSCKQTRTEDTCRTSWGGPVDTANIFKTKVYLHAHADYCVYMYVHIHRSVHAYIYVFGVYVSVCIYIYIYAYNYTYIRIYVCLYVCFFKHCIIC